MTFARQSINGLVFAVGGLVGVGLAILLLGSDEPAETGRPTLPAVAGKRPGAGSPATLPTARPRAIAAVEASETADEGDAGDAIAETRLPLRLVGTLVMKPAQRSQAVILDLDALHHMVLGEGDALARRPEVTVHSIEQRRILLETDRGLEWLRLSRGERTTELAADGEAVASAPAAERERPLRSTAELKRNRSANVRPEVIDAMNRLALHLANDLEPLYDANGRIEGVRAVSIAPEGFLEQAGIGRDEVIRGVNGVEITTPEGASRVLRDLASCEPVTGMLAGPMGGREVEIDASLLKQFGCVESR